MIQEVLANISEEHRARFHGFLTDPQEPAAKLERELDQYVSLMRAIAPRVVGVDAVLIEQLAEVCRTLLHLPSPHAQAATVVNAATRYFLRKEADYDENTAVLAFNDDVEVINAVSKAVGRPDLVVDRRRS